MYVLLSWIVHDCRLNVQTKVLSAPFFILLYSGLDHEVYEINL